MRFLVTIDGSDVGLGMPPERLAEVLDRMVIPSMEQLAQWEREGRVHGGGYAGARAGAFVIDADSSEELDRMVTGLPNWGLVKVDVKPLISASSMLERARAMRDRVQERART